MESSSEKRKADVVSLEARQKEHAENPKHLIKRMWRGKASPTSEEDFLKRKGRREKIHRFNLSENATDTEIKIAEEEARWRAGQEQEERNHGRVHGEPQSTPQKSVSPREATEITGYEDMA